LTSSDSLSPSPRSYSKVDLQQCRLELLNTDAAPTQRAMVEGTPTTHGTKKKQTRILAAIEHHLQIDLFQTSKSTENRSVQAGVVFGADSGENAAEAINKIRKHEPWKGMITTLKKLIRAEDALQRASTGIRVYANLQVPVPSEWSRSFHVMIYP